VLGVRDPAEGRAEVDPDAARVRGAIGAWGEPGVLERELSGDEAELAEAIQLAGGLRRHPRGWVEVVDLGGDMAAERARIEPVDRLDRRPPGAKAGAEGVDARPDRGDHTDPGDPDPAPFRHDDGFAVAVGADSSASASARNVPRVRPAIGRVKNRSTN